MDPESQPTEAVPVPPPAPQAEVVPAAAAPAPAEGMAAVLQSQGSAISMKQLLEAGVHFGHQTRRWNPKMKPYIFGERNGIYIIDLRRRSTSPAAAFRFVSDAVAAAARSCSSAPRSRRRTPSARRRSAGAVLRHEPLARRHPHQLQDREAGHRPAKTIEKMAEDGTYERLPKKEIAQLEREREKLEKNLGGIKDMERLPARSSSSTRRRSTSRSTRRTASASR